MKVGEKEDKRGCIGEDKGVSIKDSMEGVLVARSRVRRLCLCRMSRNKERRRKMTGHGFRSGRSFLKSCHRVVV